MEYKLILKKHLFLLFPSIIVGSVVAVSPVQAATFEAFSQLFLELKNFNQIPLGIGFSADDRVITFAETGFVETQFSKTVDFSHNNSEVNALLSSQTKISGISNRYLGLENYSVQTFGAFLVGAGQDFRFDFTAFLKLSNSTDNLLSNSVSTFGNISWFLVDSNNRVLERFQIESSINTNAIAQINKDFLNFKTNRNITFIPGGNPIFQTSFGGNNEFAQAAFFGSFQRSFSKDTLVTLVAASNFCNYSSNVVDVCVSVSEPSNKFALLLGFGCMGCIGLFSTAMKQVVQLACQPLIKQLVKNFLRNFRR
jgi:fluoride ion exporter CrcB/FEX